jgi:hypothetical protein
LVHPIEALAVIHVVEAEIHYLGLLPQLSV